MTHLVISKKEPAPLARVLKLRASGGLRCSSEHQPFFVGHRPRELDLVTVVNEYTFATSLDIADEFEFIGGWIADIQPLTVFCPQAGNPFPGDGHEQYLFCELVTHPACCLERRDEIADGLLEQAEGLLVLLPFTVQEDNKQSEHDN